MLDAEPQILHDPLIPLTDTAAWVLVVDTFTSRFGGERYLSIGNFHLDGNSDTLLCNTTASQSFLDAYYYIDDVSVIALDSLTNSVAEMGGPELFKVYPNPSNGHMTVGYSLSEGESGTLSIYSTLGGLVFQRPLAGEADRMDIDVMHLRSGIYLLHLDVNGERSFTERLSILRE